jgi:hypothetical protein
MTPNFHEGTDKTHSIGIPDFVGGEMSEEWVNITKVEYEKMIQDEIELATANAKLAKVRELCYRDGYTTWDDSMVFALNGFGAHNSEELKKWEAMHGHDIRLKCYAEFGCQLLVDPFDIIRALDEESE